MGGKLGRHHTWDNPPKWLMPNRDLTHTSEKNRKNLERSYKYYLKRLRATGSWTDHDRIKALEKERDRRRSHGENVVIDHIVPLVSNIVCGLECSRNMRIITDRENAQKGNRYWDDCPHEINGIPEQDDFFLDGKQNILI